MRTALFLGLVLLLSEALGEREILCETCQTVVHDIATLVENLPKSRKQGDLDSAVSDKLDTICNRLTEYAEKADVATHAMTKACTSLLEDDDFLEGLEDGASKKTDQELRKLLCADSGICNELWADDDMPESRESPLQRNKREGAAFLEQKKAEEGVVALPSGVLYKVVSTGEGTVKPRRRDTVSVHYRGTLINGEEFDSSYSRGQPTEFGVTGVIAGWTEALLNMHRGDKWELYIPSDQAYGDRGAGGKIGPGATLVFEVELLSIAGRDEPAEANDGEEKSEL